MPIPYSISYNFKYENDENWSQEAVFESIILAFQNVDSKTYEIGENTLKFTEQTSIIRFQYPTEILVKANSQEIHIKINVKLVELLKIILIVTVLIAFISTFSVDNYLLFTFGFAVIFYILNIIFIHTYLKQKIQSTTFYRNMFPDSEEMTNTQEEWINNPNKCAACGYNIIDTDINCPECGIRLRANKYTKPLNISKYKDNSIRYHYKEKPK